jgi:periplasmic protein TonB
MSKYGPRTADLAAGGRMTGTYDRWPLAVEYGDTASAVVERMPQPIMVRPAASERVPQMFVGLDQHTSNRSGASSTISFIIHLLVAAGIVTLGMMVPRTVVKTADTNVSPIHFTLYDPPPPPPVMEVVNVPRGGGGGGAHQLEAPIKGHVPMEAKPQIPNVRLEQAKINLPKLSVEPSAQIRVPLDSTVPQIGMAQSQQVALASQGSGSNSGFGIGMGGGIGQGHGNGMGPGANGNYGGLMNVGGGVSAPRVIHSVEPQFTPEARQANYQGVVAIQLIVDSQGNPQDVHVSRHLGMGLDERAIEAVKQYKFSPAMYQGHAVSVRMMIDVDFRLH